MNIYFVLIVQVLIASGTHIVAKSVVHDVDALTLTFLRGVLAAIGFVFLLLARGIKLRLPEENKKLIAFLGFLAVFNQYLYLYGLNFTTAANGALLYAITPIFVLILSRIFYKEKITISKSLGIMLACIGVVIVIFERGISLTSDYTYGNLMVLIAVICWAFFTVLGKRAVLAHGALAATGISNLMGFIFLFPFGVYAASTFPFQLLSTLDWVGIFYLGFGTSIISYLLWYYALRRIEATRLAVFTNGQPVVATLLAIVFLHYAITIQFIVGGIIALSGVILTQVQAKTKLVFSDSRTDR